MSGWITGGRKEGGEWAGRKRMGGVFAVVRLRKVCAI